MPSYPSSSSARTVIQMAVVAVSSYLGFFMGVGAYIGFHKLGVRSHAFFGDKSVILVPLMVAVPIVSTAASVLVSQCAGQVQLSKLGILISLVATNFGVDIELAITDTLPGRLGEVVMYLWPAMGGVYSYLGYQAGLILIRRPHSSKQVVKSVG